MSTAVDINVETQSCGRLDGALTMRPVPLFVVGMWRSGTSLLYALLNQHPQIGLMYESDFFLLPALFFLRRRNASWIPKLDSWNGALTRHKIDSSAIPEGTCGLPNAFREIAQQYARKKGATVWGCKSPNYYDCMNQLADWFPEARFIVIWRDPADVCRSIVRAARKSPWFARPGMDLRALLGYHRMKVEADKLVARGIAIHQLHYDDLVRKPVPTLSTICKFIGVPYDSRMTSLEGADRSAIYDADHHSMVKSTVIMPHRERPEVLSPALKSKVERYVAFWQKQYDGKWPVNVVVSKQTQPASLAERTRDRIRLGLLRARDAASPALYSFVPTTLWQKYRQAKSRYRQAAAQSHGGEVVQS